jgi:hypothetical protein
LRLQHHWRMSWPGYFSWVVRSTKPNRLVGPSQIFGGGWWSVAMILLGLLAFIYFFALSWILEQARSLRICRPLNLHSFVFDILGLWLCFLDVLLGLIPLHLVILGTSCSLSSGD